MISIVIFENFEQNYKFNHVGYNSINLTVYWLSCMYGNNISFVAFLNLCYRSAIVYNILLHIDVTIKGPYNLAKRIHKH